MKIPVKVYEEIKPGTLWSDILHMGVGVFTNEGGKLYLVTTI